MPKPQPVLLRGESPMEAVERLSIRDAILPHTMSIPPKFDVCYFLELQGAVRIGFTQHLAGRMKDYESYCCDPPELLGVLRGGRELERTLHGIFVPYRLRGEWYEHDGALADFTDELVFAGVL